MNAKVTGQEFLGRRVISRHFPSVHSLISKEKKKVLFTMGRSGSNYVNQMIKVSITSKGP